MPGKLPPGEAERRAAERKRAFFAGEGGARYDTKKNGFGSEAKWKAGAEAFVNGDVVLAKTPSADLILLGLEEMPDDVKGLVKAYRAASMKLYRKYGSDNLTAGYKDEFTALTKARDDIKIQKGW
jgi:hypothetical protein